MRVSALRRRPWGTTVAAEAHVETGEVASVRLALDDLVAQRP
jgi:hypothetical protein